MLLHRHILMGYIKNFAL